MAFVAFLVLCNNLKKTEGVWWIVFSFCAYKFYATYENVVQKDCSNGYMASFIRNKINLSRIRTTLRILYNILEIRIQKPNRVFDTLDSLNRL